VEEEEGQICRHTERVGRDGTHSCVHRVACVYTEPTQCARCAHLVCTPSKYREEIPCASVCTAGT